MTDRKTRLGEMLVDSGVLTPAQLEEALRAQVMWSGRLGTNLVHLEMIQLDALAKVLGRQRHLAAALEQHFERADLQLQRQLPAELAERFACIPLARIAGGRIAIASIDPLERESVRLIGDQLGIAPERLETAIAPELRIRYQLERVYGIARDVRFLRAPGKTSPPFPGTRTDLGGDPELDVDVELDLDDGGAGGIELPAKPAAPKAAPPIAERDVGFELRTAPPVTRAVSGREALVRKPPEPVRDVFDIGELELPASPATSPPAVATTRAATPNPPAARTSTSPPVVPKPSEPPALADDFGIGELELPARGGSSASPPPAARTPSAHVVRKPPEPPAVAGDLDLGELELPPRAASPQRTPAPRRGTDGDLELPARSSPVAERAILVLEDPQPADAVPTALAQRRYVRTLADASSPALPPVAAAAQRTTTKSPGPIAAKPADDASITTTIRAIRGADDRDRVAELAVEALANRIGHVAVILLVIRGEAAIGWKGFSSLHRSVDELAVPMDRAGIVPQAVERGVTQRSPISTLGTIDRRLGSALGASETDELAIIPVRIMGQVMCLFALAITTGTNLASAESVATAAGISFTRLIRNANR